MTFEYTQNIQNLYASGDCISYGKHIPCTVPNDVLKNTKVWIATNSNALADGALTASEIDSAGINLYLYSYWDANKTAVWLPGIVPLQFVASSGLVAYQSGLGWRLYESAKIKGVKANYYCPDGGTYNCKYAEISQPYSGIVQVEMTDYSGDSLSTARKYMFLTGPFFVE
jgi:hypothetical protein